MLSLYFRTLVFHLKVMAELIGSGWLWSVFSFCVICMFVLFACFVFLYYLCICMMKDVCAGGLLSSGWLWSVGRRAALANDAYLARRQRGIGRGGRAARGGVEREGGCSLWEWVSSWGKQLFVPESSQGRRWMGGASTRSLNSYSSSSSSACLLACSFLV